MSSRRNRAGSPDYHTGEHRLPMRRGKKNTFILRLLYFRGLNVLQLTLYFKSKIIKEMR